MSAMIWKGKPLECLELARSGVTDGLTCREILDELADKLDVKLSIPPEDIAATMADLMTFLPLVSISGTLKAVPADPDDDKIVECAVEGKATHIVTGDRRHLLPLRSYEGIAIVTAAEFLAFAAKP